MKRLIFALLIGFLLVLYFFGKSVYLLLTGHLDQALTGAGIAISFFVVSVFILIADFVKDFLRKTRGL